MPDFLPDVPADAVLAALSRAPGGELASGKFDSPDSSSALVANAFGRFLTAPALLPPLPGVPMGQPQRVELEVEMRFPWKGGRHPWLDVVVETATTLVGVESRRYEPFRPGKAVAFSEAYDSRDWGPGMVAYDGLRAGLAAGRIAQRHLDAVQLVKHAYGLRNQGVKRGLGAVLVYLHAAPPAWANGKPVDPAALRAHRAEIADFAARVKGADVAFVPVAWADLLASWGAVPALASHAAAIRARFGAI